MVGLVQDGDLDAAEVAATLADEVLEAVIAGETVCRAFAVTRDQWATASSTVMFACFGWSGSLKPSR